MDTNKYIIISFNTTTEAMAFEKFCIGNKVSGKLISVPKEIDSGCGLAWEIKIDEKEIVKNGENNKLNEIKNMINSNGLKCDKIVILERNKK